MIVKLLLTHVIYALIRTNFIRIIPSGHMIKVSHCWAYCIVELSNLIDATCLILPRQKHHVLLNHSCCTRTFNLSLFHIIHLTGYSLIKLFLLFEILLLAILAVRCLLLEFFSLLIGLIR